MEQQLMKLQDERNAIIRSYKRGEIHSKDICQLLRENDAKQNLVHREQQLVFAEKRRGGQGSSLRVFMRNFFQSELIKYLVLIYCVGIFMLFAPAIYMKSIGLLIVFLSSASFMATYIGIASFCLLICLSSSYRCWKVGMKNRAQHLAYVFLILATIPFLLVAEGHMREQEVTEPPVQLDNLYFDVNDSALVFHGDAVFDGTQGEPQSLEISEGDAEVIGSPLTIPLIARKFNAKTYVFPILNYNTAWQTSPNGHYVIYLPDMFN